MKKKITTGAVNSLKWYFDEISLVDDRLAEAFQFYGDLSRGPFVGVFYIDPSSGKIYSDKLILHTAYSQTARDMTVDGDKFHAPLWLLKMSDLPGWSATKHTSLPRGRVAYHRTKGVFLLSAGAESRPFRKLILEEFGLENSPVSCNFSARHYKI